MRFDVLTTFPEMFSTEPPAALGNAIVSGIEYLRLTVVPGLLQDGRNTKQSHISGQRRDVLQQDRLRQKRDGEADELEDQVVLAIGDRDAPVECAEGREPLTGRAASEQVEVASTEVERPH